MWKIRRKAKTADEIQRNLNESFDQAHRAIVRSLINVARYIPRFRSQIEQARPPLSAAQLVIFEPLLRLELTPSFLELVTHAQQHHLITFDEAQRVLAGTALEIDYPPEEI